MTQENGVDPFHLLSEEAWLKVFKYLDSDPRDMIYVGATCKKFQNLLEEKKVAGRDAGHGACRLEEVTPLILQWLPKTEALHLRLSCKRVHQLVDRLIDENKRITPYENLGLVPRLMSPHHLNLTWPRENSYEFRKFKIRSYEMGKTITSLDDIEKVEEKLKEIQIVGKFITIIVPPSKEENQLREFGKTSPPGTIQCPPGYDGTRLLDCSILYQHSFLDKIILLFTEYPQNFKYVKIVLGGMSSYYKVFHTYFRRIIASLPHVHHLIIDFDRSCFHEPHVIYEIPFTPLPLSTKLEHISIKRNLLPEAFVRQVAAKYGGNLKSLELNVTSDARYGMEPNQKLWQEELEDDGKQYEFPALCDVRINHWDEDTVLMLARINAPQSKRLFINIFKTDNYYLRSRAVIRIILMFPLVKFLQFGVEPKVFEHPMAVLEGLDTTTERHENVMAISLSGSVFSSNLALRLFALLCPNAYYMDVCASDPEDPTEDEDLKLLRDRRLNESRIWMDATNLELVRLVDSSNSGSGPYISHRPEIG